jgi:hypothetical protein
MCNLSIRVMFSILFCFGLSFSAQAQGNFDASSFTISGKGGKGKPFMVVIPGSGGNAPQQWVSFATSAGFGVVSVNLGNIYGRPLYNISESTMAQAVAQAVKVGIEAGFNGNKYALLGLSKGGTVAMIASSNIRSGGSPAPKAVFAFYPGSMGSCPLSASSETAVHIFYGDADEWGNFRGTRQACAGRSGGNVTYHEYAGAHHGFDGSGNGKFACCGGEFRYQGNGAAAAKAKATVRSTLSQMR